MFRAFSPADKSLGGLDQFALGLIFGIYDRLDLVLGKLFGHEAL